MKFEELVDQAEQMLARRGRLTYALLRRHFELDESALGDLVLELTEGRRVAADENGIVLTWTGGANTGGRQVERRQLTVLFCDLVDSTRLSSRLDPEDYGDLLHRYQDICAGVVARFDCRIAQMLGDGVLVYAGYPVAHEDSPERAVRIGIGILEKLRSMNAELADTGEQLAVRIGIHTGLVIVGDVDHGLQREELALGETPNVAARIQSLARPDTIVVSDATHRLLGGRFDCENLGQHRLKGIAEPVTAFRIRGESGAAVEHVRSRNASLPALVGRTGEMAVLRRSLDAALAGRGSAVCIVGEAGIGKTRLIQALCAEATPVANNLFDCRGSPHHQDTPLRAIVNAFERLLGWSDSTDSGDRLARIERALEAYPVDPREVIPLFAPLLLLDLPPSRYDSPALPPQRQRTRLLDTLIEIARARAREQPLLLILEDLQWFDPSSLELLDRLLAEVSELPILLLLSFRPEFTPTWSASPACINLHLDRIDAAESARIVEQIAGPAKLPAATVDQIVERADGIPLFVEEITKTVNESGPSVSSIPSSLHDSLMARLDRLSGAKTVALEAAVLGREFDLSLLEAISELDPDTLAGELDRLVSTGLLQVVDGTENLTYAFRQVLVRDVAYGSILRRSRREIHQRIAAALETRFHGIRDRQPEILAHHYLEAGNPEGAALNWRRAGASADARSAYVEAARHYSRALEAVRSTPETENRRREETELLLDVGRTRAIVCGWGATEIEDIFRQALALSQSTGDQQLAFVAISGLRTNSLLRGNIRRGQELAEELLEVALEAKRPAEIMIARGLLGDSLYRLGEIDLAVSQLERGRALIPQWRADTTYAGEDTRVHGLSHLSLALWMQGHPGQALARIGEAEELAASLQHPLSIAYALRFSADLHLRCRLPGPAMQKADELLSVAHEQDFAHHLSIGSILRGWARCLSAADPSASVTDAQSGLDEMRQGLAAYRETGAIVNLPFFLAILAEACALHGDRDEAFTLIQDALESSRKSEESWWDAEILRTRGMLAELDPNSGASADDAQTSYREALAVAKRQGAGSLELRAATALYRYLGRDENRVIPTDYLSSLVGRFAGEFETPDLREARALLIRLSSSGQT